MEAPFKFGPYKIDAREVFHATPLSYAMVNLRPLLPGHILLFRHTIADVNHVILSESHCLGEFRKMALKAGQTVPHVHIHVIPRRTGDFEKNDEIYDAIDLKEKELKEKLDLDIERKDRTMEEMAHEANEYRALFS